MTRVIWLHDGGRLLWSLRLACRMSHDEFADMLAAELGWQIPATVLRAWERGQSVPPPGVVETGQALADLHLSGPVDRREFLRRSTAAAALTAAALKAGASAALQVQTSPEHEAGSRPIQVRGNVHAESLSDLNGMLDDYRRSYGQTSAEQLLPRAVGLVHMLVDMENAPQTPSARDRLTSLTGQAALLAGLVSLMGPHDLVKARSYYDLALAAASESGDADLATYVRGSLSFHDTRSGRPAEGLERIRAAQEQADSRTSPMTRAWLASLASELHARAGDELSCRRCLEQAEAALDTVEDGAPPWKGIGVFDRSKLVAYQGGDLVLLSTAARGATAVRRAQEAEALLVDALADLNPSRVKHRCTALGDVAMALTVQEEIEQACVTAGDALTLAEQLGHRESIGRVQKVQRRLQRWKTHPAVRDLGERLLLAT